MRRCKTNTLIVATALSAMAICLSGYTSDPATVRVTVKDAPVGKITLGSGWATWDHWWDRKQGPFRLEWSDAQWDAYLGLLKDSGADWVKLDFYYGDTEPRNDNGDPEVINWAAFTFDSPRLKSLYKHLDFFQANGIDSYLTYTYLRDNHAYNADRLTGWLSKEAVLKGFPELWTRPRDEPVDKRALARNLAATAYYLRERLHYTNLEQVSLYVEPDNGRPTGGQWKNVDGYRDTIFLGKLLTKLGIRDQLAILAPHSGIENPEAWPPQPADYDIHAVEDYKAAVDWSDPQRGLTNLYPGYRTMVKELKAKRPSMEAALVEYGDYWCWGATDPSCAYLKTLSSSSLVFELYNAGFAGALRWAFEPLYHPYLGFGVMKVEGVSYPPAAPSSPNDQPSETLDAIMAAMRGGAKVVKVPYTYEPQRLLQTNLHRGSTVYDVEVSDPTPPGKGIYAIAVKDKNGKAHIGLINLYPDCRNVELVLPRNVPRGPLRWDYYHAEQGFLHEAYDWLGDRFAGVAPLQSLFRTTAFALRTTSEPFGGGNSFPDRARSRFSPRPVGDTLSLHLAGQSLNFLSELAPAANAGGTR